MFNLQIQVEKRYFLLQIRKSHDCVQLTRASPTSMLCAVMVTLLQKDIGKLDRLQLTLTKIIA